MASFAAIPARADDDVGPAGAFVEEVAAEVIDIINAPPMSESERVRRYHSVFDRSLDSDLIARVAVGRHWRRATPRQRVEYLALFRRHVAAIYAAQFGSHPNAKMEVVNEIQASPTDTLVSTQIDLPNADPLDTVFRVSRHDDGQFRIVDVTVNGMSLVLTKRAEIDSIVVHKGFGALLAALKNNRIAEVDAREIFKGL